MEKQEWEKVYNTLDKIHTDFLDGYDAYINGSNAAKRKDGERKYDNALGSANSFITRHAEVYELIVNKEIQGTSNSAYNYEDDFLRPQYFGSEMGKLLKAITEKIQSL